MLSENIKKLRKTKGLSQEELAMKLNVVRQTVSKWEQGLSVPDSAMLINIAEALDTTVGVLLGEEIQENENNELKSLAAKLETLNEQFAKRNEAKRRAWRIVFIVAASIVGLIFLGELISFFHLCTVIKTTTENVGVIGGSAGPTDIYVSSVKFHVLPFIITLAVGIVSVIGIFKTRGNK